MLKFSEESKKFLAPGKANTQLIIPVSQTEDFTISGLYSSVEELATLRWSASLRQVYVVCVANTGENNSFSFSGHTSVADTPLNQPASGEFLMVPNGQGVLFCNTPLTADPAYNISKNGDILIIDDCTIANYTFSEIVSFDMSLKFVGDQSTGKNILMLAADAIS